MLLLAISLKCVGILKHGLSVSKAYLTDIVNTQERQSVLGMFNACSSLGFIFGPLISGYLADRDPSMHLSVLTGAGVFGANFLLVTFLVPSTSLGVHTSTDSLEPENPTQFSSYKSLLNIFNISTVHWRELWDVIAIQFLLTFSVIIFKVNFVIYMDEEFHISSTAVGQLLSFQGLASAIGSATSGRISNLYTSNTKQVLHFTVLLAGSLTCLALAPSVVYVALLVLPLSLSTANLRICLLSLMLQRGTEEEKGAIVGLANSVGSVSRMLAPTVVGICQEYGVRVPGYVSAALALGAAGIALVCYLNSPSPEIEQ